MQSPARNTTASATLPHRTARRIPAPPGRPKPDRVPALRTHSPPRSGHTPPSVAFRAFAGSWWASRHPLLRYNNDAQKQFSQFSGPQRTNDGSHRHYRHTYPVRGRYPTDPRPLKIRNQAQSAGHGPVAFLRPVRHFCERCVLATGHNSTNRQTHRRHLPNQQN